MNFNPVKTLLLGLFLSFFSLLNAQDDAACTLPAPQNIVATLTPPDATFVSWQAVTGATGYDVLLIDFDNNLVLYSNTVYSTSVTINGIIPPPNSIVAVAALCENGNSGGYGIESVVTIHVEDLIVQRDNGGPTTTYTCNPDNAQDLDINWDSGPGTVSVPITNNSPNNYRKQVKTFVQIATPNAPNLVSLVELQNSPSGNVTNATFPHNISFQGVSSTMNTNKPSAQAPVGSNIYKVDYNLSPNNPANFYELDLNSSTQADFTFDQTFSYNVTVNVMNCFEGKREDSSTGGGDDDEGPGDLGLQSNNQQNHQQGIDNRSTTINALALSPNPVADRLTVRLKQAGQLTIFDRNGRAWYQEKTQDNTLRLSVADWPAGLYILRQDTAEGVLIQRFVKL